MAGEPQCPKHGRMTWVNGEWVCGTCEAAIKRAESIRDDPPDETNWYERWTGEP